MTSLSHSSLASRGFSLIQVMFVILGLTIAASVSLMTIEPQRSSGGLRPTEEQLEKIKAAAIIYREHMGSAPATIDHLVRAPAGAPVCDSDKNPSSANFRKIVGWCGPYLDSALSDIYRRDGWNSLLQYNQSMIRSCGPNRQCGDSDDLVISL